MKKTPINVSHPLKDAVGDMREKANPKLVGLVMRFNEDDKTIRDLWSEGARTGKHEHNPPWTDRLQVYRHINDNNLVAGEYPANKVNAVAGYHAEELFIICWEALLRECQLQEDQIGKIDLVLSKSPCHGSSTSSAMKLRGITRYLPIGCASKLASFVTSKDQRIEWRIAFLALAGSDAENYAPIGTGASRLMSKRELQLAEAAHCKATTLDKLNKELEDLEKKNKTATSFLTDNANTLEGTARNNAYANAKKAKRQVTQKEKEVNDQTGTLSIPARTQSIMQAQQGIAILDRLPNVDVRRWQP